MGDVCVLTWVKLTCEVLQCESSTSCSLPSLWWPFIEAGLGPDQGRGLHPAGHWTGASMASRCTIPERRMRIDSFLLRVDMDNFFCMGFGGAFFGVAVSVVWRERFMEAKMLLGKILFIKARMDGREMQAKPQASSISDQIVMGT